MIEVVEVVVVVVDVVDVVVVEVVVLTAVNVVGAVGVENVVVAARASYTRVLLKSKASMRYHSLFMTNNSTVRTSLFDIMSVQYIYKI